MCCRRAAFWARSCGTSVRSRASSRWRRWSRIDRLDEGGYHVRRLARSSWLWLAAGSLAPAGLLGALIRSGFGPPASLGAFIVISVVLGAFTAVPTRSRDDPKSLAYRSRVRLLVGRPVDPPSFDVFDPVDPVERFLAQARDDYSEFNYPRRWVPAVAVGAILIGGGLFAAWRTGRVRMGTMAAAQPAPRARSSTSLLSSSATPSQLGPQDPSAMCQRPAVLRERPDDAHAGPGDVQHPARDALAASSEGHIHVIRDVHNPTAEFGSSRCSRLLRCGRIRAGSSPARERQGQLVGANKRGIPCATRRCRRTGCLTGRLG